MALHAGKSRAVDGRASRSGAPRAFTLLELLATVALMGVLAAVGIAAVRASSLANAGAATQARLLAQELQHARRAAIAHGDNHLLLFSQLADGAWQYRLYRRSRSLIPVDAPRTMPTDLYLKFTSAAPEFTFEGSAVSAWQCYVVGPDRYYLVEVHLATGAVTVSEL